MKKGQRKKIGHHKNTSQCFGLSYYFTSFVKAIVVTCVIEEMDGAKKQGYLRDVIYEHPLTIAAFK